MEALVERGFGSQDMAYVMEVARGRA
jgi:hypothetical protein